MITQASILMNCLFITYLAENITQKHGRRVLHLAQQKVLDT